MKISRIKILVDEDTIKKVKEGKLGSNFSRNVDDLKAFADSTEDQLGRLTSLRSLSDNLGEGLFRGLVDGINSNSLEEAGKSFVRVLSDFLLQLGKQLILLGTAKIALGFVYLSNPATAAKAPVEFAAGGKALAAGLAITAGGALAGRSVNSGQSGQNIANNTSDPSKEEYVLSTRVVGSDLEFIVRKYAKKSRKGN